MRSARSVQPRSGSPRRSVLPCWLSPRQGCDVPLYLRTPAKLTTRFFRPAPGERRVRHRRAHGRQRAVISPDGGRLAFTARDGVRKDSDLDSSDRLAGSHTLLPGTDGPPSSQGSGLPTADRAWASCANSRGCCGLTPPAVRRRPSHRRRCSAACVRARTVPSCSAEEAPA